MTPEQMVKAAFEVAQEGLAVGELPIGAVVVMGDQIVGRAYTQERGRRRRLVHADLLSMTQADERLGWTRRPHRLRLAVNLEPCVMCLGAAMTGGILRRECRELFRQYCQTAPESGLRSWAQTIADLPD